MKKVLQLLTTPLQYDGLSKVALSCYESVKDDDQFEVSFLLGRGAVPDFYRKLEEATFPYYQGSDRSKSLLAYSVFLYRLLRQEKFDVVHVHGNSATMTIELTLAALCRVPVRIAHSHNTATKYPLIHKCLKPLFNQLVNVPVACGQQAGLFLFNKSFTIIPNAIEVEKYYFNETRRNKIRAELGLENKQVIGHIGRFTHQKNHRFLIELFASLSKTLPNAQLLLVGEGELLEEMKALVTKEGLVDQVTFYGVSDQVENLLQAMDVFLLPSHHEGLVMTGIEAQVSGLPCLFSTAVSEEVAITANCQFIDLNAPLSVWEQAILAALRKETSSRRVCCQMISKTGYDKKELGAIVSQLWNSL